MDNSSDSEWGSSGTSVMMIKNFPIQTNAGNLTSYDLLTSEKKKNTCSKINIPASYSEDRSGHCLSLNQTSAVQIHSLLKKPVSIPSTSFLIRHSLSPIRCYIKLPSDQPNNRPAHKIPRTRVLLGNLQILGREKKLSYFQEPELSLFPVLRRKNPVYAIPCYSLIF